MIKFFAENENHDIFGYPYECDECTANKKNEAVRLVPYVYLDGLERGMDLVYASYEDVDHILESENIIEDCVVKYIDGDEIHAKLYAWKSCEGVKGLIVYPYTIYEQWALESYNEKAWMI